VIIGREPVPAHGSRGRVDSPVFGLELRILSEIGEKYENGKRSGRVNAVE